MMQESIDWQRNNTANKRPSVPGLVQLDRYKMVYWLKDIKVKLRRI
jgi:hypothetical protein